MGLLDFFSKDRQIKKLTAQISSLQSYNVFNTVAATNQNLAIYPSWDITSQTERYLDTDDVYSIIRKLATTAALVPLYAFLQTPDKKAFQTLRRSTKGYSNPIRHKSIQTKALTDLPDNDPVAMLLEHPHVNMSKFEFFEAAYSFLFTFGEVFLLKERPELGVNQGLPVQLQFMYPQYVIARISQTFPRRIVAYDYRVNGVLIQANIPASDVIHIKYFNPDMNYLGAELRGLSPLQVLKKRLTRLDSNMDVSVAQLQHGGVPGIVYDKVMPGDPASVAIQGLRQEAFYKYLNNSANSGAPYFASGEMGYIQTGMKLADLTVADLANIDFKKLCNVFGVSDILFNSDAASTESNVLIMTKSLYTNTVLPNVYRMRDGLINGILPDFKDGVMLSMPDVNGNTTDVRIKGDGKLRYIDADISEIAELHADLEKKAAAIALMWHLTPNEKREMQDWEKYDDPKFDVPWIPTGFTPLDDFENMPPLPIVTPGGN